MIVCFLCCIANNEKLTSFVLDDEVKQGPSSLKTEGVCRALEELFKQYDLNAGATVLQKQLF